MTKRVCQVCGEHKHIDKMEKVGARYACSGPFSGCVRRAKSGDILTNKKMAMEKAEERFYGKVVFGVLVFFFSFLVFVEFYSGILELFGVGPTYAKSIGFGFSFVTLGLASGLGFLLFAKFRNK